MQRDPNIHRELHDLEQGTPAWDAYRANHDNASDAPAMMSCSPYKTRSELIRQYATGITPEIDARTQKLFNDGHRFEALARDHVAALGLVGMELYPNIASLGRLSASYDGLTMCETIVWEHKSLNNDIRACDTAADLPQMYRIQMEQQMHIVGAEKALFSATRWGDIDVTPLEEKHLWYTPDMALRQQIIDGWEQFALDVAAYVPQEVINKPEAAPAAALPALVVHTEGKVVSSNLMVYQKAAEKFLLTIKTDLQDDQDFADAEYNVKFCGEAEDKLELAKAAALAQTSTIDEVMRTVDHIKEQFRAKRLQLEKLVKTRKEQIKETILNEGKREYVDHIAALEKEIAPLRLTLLPPDFAGAMKNKRTLASLHDAVNTTLANAKIEANQRAADYRIKQAWCKESAAGYGHLFMDMAQIIGKPMEDFQLVVRTRIADHERAEAAKQEALRAKIAAEEKAKAEAAAAAELAAQRRADAERQAAADQAERERVAAATKAQLEQQAAQVSAQRAAQAEADRAALATQPTRESALAAAQQSIDQEKAAALADQGQLTDLANAQTGTAVADDLFSTGGAASISDATTAPALRLGQIGERLGISLTADFLTSLGFAPVATDRAAKLYHEADFPRMCAALSRHIAAVQAKYSV